MTSASTTVLTRYSGPAVAAICLVAAAALGSVIAVSPALAVFLLLAAAAGILVLRQPTGVLPALLALAVVQPILLRWIPDSREYWVWVRRADELTLAIFLPLACLRLLHQRRSPLSPRMLLCVAVICVTGVAAAFMRSTPAAVASLDAFLLFKGLAIFVIAYAFCPSPESTRRLIDGIVAGGVVLGLLGIIEMFFPDGFRQLLPLPWTTQGTRSGQTCLVSIFEHEGQAGWFFAFVATVAFAAYIVSRRQLMLGGFVFLSLCSVLTLRRKPIVGLVVMMLVYVLIGYRTSRRLRAATVLVILLLAGAAFFGDTLVGVFVDGYNQYLGVSDRMKVARNAMYVTSFRIAWDSFPLGVGFGVFGGYTSKLFYSPVYYEYGLAKVWGLSPENDHFIMDAFWPHVLGQFGFLGLAAYLALLVLLWGPVLRIMREPGGGVQRVLAAACVLTFVEALVESTAQSVFESTLSAFFLFGLLAVSRAQESDRAARVGGAAC